MLKQKTVSLLLLLRAVQLNTIIPDHDNHVGLCPRALQVLGDGELAMPLTIHATQFSGSARTKIEAAGGTIVEVPAKVRERLHAQA